ncbi:MAG: hypothetical protein ACI9YE_000404 [Psychroserpens sp.]|jgi:hypothetical protein
MKIYKTPKGYCYKEYKNGKKIRISKENYLKLKQNKKVKTKPLLRKQKGGINFDGISKINGSSFKNIFGISIGPNYSKYIRGSNNDIYYYYKNAGNQTGTFINLSSQDFDFIKYLVKENINLDEIIESNPTDYTDILETLLKVFQYSKKIPNLLEDTNLRNLIKSSKERREALLQIRIRSSMIRKKKVFNFTHELIDDFPNDTIRQIIVEHPFYTEYMRPILATKQQKAVVEYTYMAKENMKKKRKNKVNMQSGDIEYVRPQYLLDLLYGTNAHIVDPADVYKWWNEISMTESVTVKKSKDYIFIPGDIERILEILQAPRRNSNKLGYYDIKLCIVYNVINHILRIITNYSIYFAKNENRNMDGKTNAVNEQLNYRKQAYDKFKLVLDMAYYLFTHKTYPYYTEFILKVIDFYKSRIVMGSRIKINKEISSKYKSTEYNENIDHLKYLTARIKHSMDSKYFFYALTIAPNEKSFINTYCVPMLPFACTYLSTHEYKNEIIFYHPINHIYHDLMFHLYINQCDYTVMEKQYSYIDYSKTFDFRQRFISSLDGDEKTIMFEIIHEHCLTDLKFLKKPIDPAIFLKLEQLKRDGQSNIFYGQTKKWHRPDNLEEAEKLFVNLPATNYYFTYSLDGLQAEISKYKLNQSVSLNPIFLIAHFRKFSSLLDAGAHCYLYNTEDYELVEYTASFFQNLTTKLINAFNLVFPNQSQLPENHMPTLNNVALNVIDTTLNNVALNVIDTTLNNVALNVIDTTLNVVSWESMSDTNKNLKPFLTEYDSSTVPYCSILSFKDAVTYMSFSRLYDMKTNKAFKFYPMVLDKTNGKSNGKSNVNTSLVHRFFVDYGITESNKNVLN